MFKKCHLTPGWKGWWSKKSPKWVLFCLNGTKWQRHYFNISPLSKYISNNYLNGATMPARIAVTTEDITTEVWAAPATTFHSAVAACVSVHRSTAFANDLIQHGEEAEQSQAAARIHLNEIWTYLFFIF